MNEHDELETAVPETAVTPQTQPPKTPTATLSEKTLLLVIAILVIGIDQYTKYLVESNLALFDVYAPIPSLEHIFRIFHIFNTGATFGLFSGGGDIFRYLAIVVSLGIIYYNFILPANHRMLRLALGLQMGGALGNMIDRFRIGHVTDFIDIGPWYIFNLADLAVVSGAVILGIMVWQESRELKAQQRATAEAKNGLETAVPPQTDPSHE
ncbi:MAG: signal peptidase II [Ardenticatenaceae bacterium]|nr:signal peptidase II [Anaerolineales bacterium]MCB8939641.1 signal peptidase II [Ardenticatenaceae bacterium]MCB8974934.1 signal peptidase II [Ardenticatenaceae bacterium]